jgi:hypothetical protein
MAIGTFSELETALANWLNRADLSDRIPEFIELAEARMNRDRRLRVVDAITRDTLTVNSQFTALPSDFARMVNCEYQSDPVLPMEALSPQQMDVHRSQGTTGDPRYYCVIGNELEVVPVQSEDATLGIVYHRRISALSDSNTTNWLLTAAPDIYLYACKLEACLYLHEDERVPVFQALYDQRASEYLASSEEDESAGSPLVVRGPTFY